MKYTHKAPFDKGYNGMVSAVEHPEMMGMEFGVVKMAAGDVMHFDYAQEVVYDLMSGSVTFAWNGNSETVTRKDVFHEGAILLHVPQNTKVTISAESDAEIAVSRTANSYGLAEYGDDAFKVKNNDLTGMPENVTHSQAAAPGYAEYYLWCIRLQDDKNIVTTVVPEYEWVTKADAKYFPDI